MREEFSLNGTWEFVSDPDRSLTYDRLGAMQPIRVPGPWQTQLPALRHYRGVAWYRLRFPVPPTWPGQRIRLHFEAVNYLCQAWLNGHFLGQHEGGYLPFCFDIDHLVKPGAEAVLVLRVLLTLV